MSSRNIAALVASLLMWSISGLSANAIAGTVVTEAGDAKKAEPIATQVCAACHAADGNSSIPLNPKLAGQHPAYISRQLDNFKSGERKSDVMKAIAATLTAEDMVNLGNYYEAQTAKLAKARSNGVGSAGEKIYRAGIPGANIPACASCHGPSGAGIPAQFPRLAGQHADYTSAQLRLFRSGERANDPAKMMRMISARMSDEEISAVADYIQGLR